MRIVVARHWSSASKKEKWSNVRLKALASGLWGWLSNLQSSVNQRVFPVEKRTSVIGSILLKSCLFLAKGGLLHNHHFFRTFTQNKTANEPSTQSNKANHNVTTHKQTLNNNNQNNNNSTSWKAPLHTITTITTPSLPLHSPPIFLRHQNTANISNEKNFSVTATTTETVGSTETGTSHRV